MNKMNEHKFAVGDRVIYNPKRTGNGWLAGEHGTVIYVDSTEPPIRWSLTYPSRRGIPTTEQGQTRSSRSRGTDGFARRKIWRRKHE